MKVLITGASGYIGRQLAEKLSAAGHDVTCMIRNAARVPQVHGPQIKFVEADALQAETLSPARKGIYVAYYLIHSMSGRVEGFESRDPPRNGRGVARLRAASRRTAGRHHRWQWQYLI